MSSGASSSSNQPREQTLSEKLKLGMSGGMVLVKTTALRLAGQGNPHLTLAGEAVLRFMQQFRDPKHLSSPKPPSEKALQKLRDLMDQSAGAPLWVRRQTVSIPPLSPGQPSL